MLLLFGFLLSLSLLTVGLNSSCRGDRLDVGGVCIEKLGPLGSNKGLAQQRPNLLRERLRRGERVVARRVIRRVLVGGDPWMAVCEAAAKKDAGVSMKNPVEAKR